MSIADAAVEAARIRLRPILMTSLAFILGVMPLVFASGAGREARHSVGTAVAGGMIASTFLNLAFIPVLYVVVKSLAANGRRVSGCADGEASALGARRWPCSHARDLLGARRSVAQHRRRCRPARDVQQAIERAIETNPDTSRRRRAGILRAEGLLAQARAATLSRCTAASRRRR